MVIGYGQNPFRRGGERPHPYKRDGEGSISEPNEPLKVMCNFCKQKYTIPLLHQLNGLLDNKTEISRIICDNCLNNSEGNSNGNLDGF